LLDRSTECIWSAEDEDNQKKAEDCRQTSLT
jgi:hypothetical protein